MRGPIARREVADVEVEVVGADDVAEDRRRSDADDRVRRRDEVQRRQNDLVAGPAARREQREMKRGSPVGDRERVRHAQNAAKPASNSATRGPMLHQPDASTSRAAVEQLVVDPDVGEGNAPWSARVTAARRLSLPSLHSGSYCREEVGGRMEDRCPGCRARRRPWAPARAVHHRPSEAADAARRPRDRRGHRRPAGGVRDRRHHALRRLPRASDRSGAQRPRPRRAVLVRLRAGAARNGGAAPPRRGARRARSSR